MPNDEVNRERIHLARDARRNEAVETRSRGGEER